MNFLFSEYKGKSYEISDVISYELTSEIGAACDGLRLKFRMESPPGEIYSVKAYDDGKLIFSGFCDLQQAVTDKDGTEYFVYARSSASLLVDNEAAPRQYTYPSARQLWFSNAKELGFECGLPDISSKNSYLVSKGTSCYGAINDFVSAVYGSSVYVTPENVLKVFEKSKKVKRLSDYKVSSAAVVISRSSPLSETAYKINSTDNYIYHFKSRFSEKQGINRKRLLNLSSLPAWQRETTAVKRMNDALSDYYSVRAVICGKCDFQLNDRVYADIVSGFDKDVFYVNEIIKCKDKNGEKNTVILKKEISGELINYVD